MKYIDVELLRERIEKIQYAIEPMFIKGDDSVYDGENDAYNRVLRIIDSLEQEQESVAERFARIVRGNLIGIDKDVQQKFEQLYFEITGNKMYGGYND